MTIPLNGATGPAWGLVLPKPGTQQASGRLAGLRGAMPGASGKWPNEVAGAQRLRWEKAGAIQFSGRRPAQEPQGWWKTLLKAGVMALGVQGASGFLLPGATGGQPSLQGLLPREARSTTAPGMILDGWGGSAPVHVEPPVWDGLNTASSSPSVSSEVPLNRLDRRMERRVDRAEQGTRSAAQESSGLQDSAKDGSKKTEDSSAIRNTGKKPESPEPDALTDASTQRLSHRENPAELAIEPLLLASPLEALQLAASHKIAPGLGAIKLITGPQEEDLFYEIRLKNGSVAVLTVPQERFAHQEFLHALKNQYGLTPQPTPTSQSTFLGSIFYHTGEALIVIGLITLLRKMAQAGKNQNVGQTTQYRPAIADGRTASKSIGFDDIRGYPEVIRELKRVRDRYVRSNLQPPGAGKIQVKPIKGILLEGPPGTGKSMMAKALAAESRVPFHYVSGSQFVELYVGVGAARVRSLFAQAKKDADRAGGAIVFIDELDSIGGKRERGVGGGHDERIHALNELLQQMSGFNDDPRIMVLAATNRSQDLDDALKRSGRFDKIIPVDLPRDKAQRVDILNKYLAEHPVGRTLDPDVMAEFTYGKSGADLANLVNQMAEVAWDRIAEAQENPEKAALLEDPEFHKLQSIDFFNTLRNMEMGLPRVAQGTADERRTVAVHEVVGHGLVARATRTPLHIVSMQPRGNALGHVITDPRVRSQQLPTLESLLKELVVLMGGRASERELLGQERITPGASGDIQQSQAKIRQMLVTRMLSQGSGAEYKASSALNEQDRRFSDQLLRQAEETASAVIRKVPRAELDRLVDKALNLKEELEGEAANAFYDEVLGIVGPQALYEPIQQFIATVSSGDKTAVRNIGNRLIEGNG